MDAEVAVAANSSNGAAEGAVAAAMHPKAAMVVVAAAVEGQGEAGEMHPRAVAAAVERPSRPHLPRQRNRRRQELKEISSRQPSGWHPPLPCHRRRLAAAETTPRLRLPLSVRILPAASR